MTEQLSLVGEGARPAAASPAEVAPRLLPWFDSVGRELPWRGCGDPYRIWVSEIMCQQTRISVVIPYYHRFLERFPTVHALAAAEEDDVLAAWSGLGFYRRARNLHAGARQVVEQYGGVVPEDPAVLGAIKGIGRYTVGAILSAAHDQRLPILDGNVIRVLSRFFRVDGPPDRAATQKTLWRLAEEVLPHERPGDFNQALMDLGALVCKPSGPTCDTCPLADRCLGLVHGDAESFPRPGRKQTVTFVVRAALRLVRPDGRLLLERRPDRGLLPNLWELPAAVVPDAASPEASARALLRKVSRAHGLPPSLVDHLVPAGPTEHRFSHRHWTTWVFDVACPLPSSATESRKPERRWVHPSELPDLGLPTASRKAIDLPRNDLLHADRRSPSPHWSP